ncbi:methyltransferase domain-containing protein [Singulisphaera sp. Ch08]|uniref:Methyltransferase domain-containing protein n=1 Tax=Singulisphaera sp. Ch08 TaxID=3120278 RepID=A0AAU7CNM0_9BACT
MTSIDFNMGPKESVAAAEAYARLREPLTLPYGLDTLAALCLQPGERLLDLATGTGGVALAAARQGAEVVAVDWSPGMVGFLDARTKGEGVEGVSARVMDGQNLELPSAHFDAACSVFGIMFFPDHRAGLSELLRVLKPGGRVGIAVWASPSRMGHLGVWEQAAHRICYPHAPRFPRPPAWLQMDSPEGLRRELEAVGFRDVSVTRITHGWNVPSARWFIDNADASQSLSESPDTRKRIRESVLAQLDDEYGDGPFALTAHAHIGIATR